MPQVTLTRHLFEFFPSLENQALVVQASSVADVVREMEKLAPGFSFYVCDERGRLRKHVNVFAVRVAGARQAAKRGKPVPAW